MDIFQDLTPWAIALRASLIYVATILLVRVGSARLLGKATAFDITVGIMLGSVMSRGINGSAAVLETLVAGAILVGLHRLFAVGAFHTRLLGPLFKGTPSLLIKDGVVQEKAMRRASLSRNDLAEVLRLEGIEDDPSKVKRAYIERNGRVSILRREPVPRVIEVQVHEGVQTVRIQLE